MQGLRQVKISAALLALCLLLTGCGSPAAQNTAEGATSPSATGSLELKYAEQFTVELYDDGSALLTIADADRFLVVPSGSEAPDSVEDGVTVLYRPVQTVYLAATSAMDLFLQLGALDSVRMTSTTYTNWGLQEVRDALDSGDMLYAGKYSAPDFELLLSEGCDIAIESTMIYHSPDIKEKLETLGIPVLVERSSYEPDPLGRVEWIKVYGLLTGRLDEAVAFFDSQIAQLEGLDAMPATEQTVAFFHISTSGAVVVRKPGDYVSRMIEMAGGSYVFTELESEDDNALSTINMQMEAFYAGARDADVLIYNSTIDGEIDTLEQLLEKSSLLADFTAFQTGNVWCTEHNMFQQSSATAGMIADFNAIITGQADGVDQLTFLHRLT